MLRCPAAAASVPLSPCFPLHSNDNKVCVDATGVTYFLKDLLKNNGGAWDAEEKAWIGIDADCIHDIINLCDKYGMDIIINSSVNMVAKSAADDNKRAAADADKGAADAKQATDSADNKCTAKAAADVEHTADNCSADTDNDALGCNGFVLLQHHVDGASARDVATELLQQSYLQASGLRNEQLLHPDDDIVAVSASCAGGALGDCGVLCIGSCSGVTVSGALGVSGTLGVCSSLGVSCLLGVGSIGLGGALGACTRPISRNARRRLRRKQRREAGNSAASLQLTCRRRAQLTHRQRAQRQMLRYGTQGGQGDKDQGGGSEARDDEECARILKRSDKLFARKIQGLMARMSSSAKKQKRRRRMLSTRSALMCKQWEVLGLWRQEKQKWQREKPKEGEGNLKGSRAKVVMEKWLTEEPKEGEGKGSRVKVVDDWVDDCSLQFCGRTYYHKCKGWRCQVFVNEQAGADSDNEVINGSAQAAKIVQLLFSKHSEAERNPMNFLCGDDDADVQADGSSLAGEDARRTDLSWGEMIALEKLMIVWEALRAALDRSMKWKPTSIFAGSAEAFGDALSLAQLTEAVFQGSLHAGASSLPLTAYTASFAAHTGSSSGSQQGNFGRGEEKLCSLGAEGNDAARAWTAEQFQQACLSTGAGEGASLGVNTCQACKECSSATNGSCSMGYVHKGKLVNVCEDVVGGLAVFMTAVEEWNRQFLAQVARNDDSGASVSVAMVQGGFMKVGEQHLVEYCSHSECVTVAKRDEHLRTIFDGTKGFEGEGPPNYVAAQGGKRQRLHAGCYAGALGGSGFVTDGLVEVAAEWKTLADLAVGNLGSVQDLRSESGQNGGTGDTVMLDVAAGTGLKYDREVFQRWAKDRFPYFRCSVSAEKKSKTVCAAFRSIKKCGGSDTDCLALIYQWAWEVTEEHLVGRMKLSASQVLCVKKFAMTSQKWVGRCFQDMTDEDPNTVSEWADWFQHRNTDCFWAKWAKGQCAHCTPGQISAKQFQTIAARVFKESGEQGSEAVSMADQAAKQLMQLPAGVVQSTFLEATRRVEEAANSSEQALHWEEGLTKCTWKKFEATVKRGKHCNMMKREMVCAWRKCQLASDFSSKRVEEELTFARVGRAADVQKKLSDDYPVHFELSQSRCKLCGCQPFDPESNLGSNNQGCCGQGKYLKQVPLERYPQELMKLCEKDWRGDGLKVAGGGSFLSRSSRRLNNDFSFVYHICSAQMLGKRNAWYNVQQDPDNKFSILKVAERIHQFIPTRNCKAMDFFLYDTLSQKTGPGQLQEGEEAIYRQVGNIIRKTHPAASHLRNVQERLNKGEFGEGVVMEKVPVAQGVQELGYVFVPGGSASRSATYEIDDGYGGGTTYRCSGSPGEGCERKRQKAISVLSPHLNSLSYPILFPSGEQTWGQQTPGGAFKPREFRLLDQCKSLILRGELNNTDIATHEGSTVEPSWWEYRSPIDHATFVAANRFTAFGSVGQEFILSEYLRSLDVAVDWQMRKSFQKVHNTGEQKNKLTGTLHGSKRNLRDKFHNALTLVRNLGKPTFFVTATVNKEWNEIVDSVLPEQTWADRPDIVTRVFNIKRKALVQWLKTGAAFQQCRTANDQFKYGMYSGDEQDDNPGGYMVDVIEFQHRGLPHAHIAYRPGNGGGTYGEGECGWIDETVCANRVPSDHEERMQFLIRWGMVSINKDTNEYVVSPLLLQQCRTQAWVQQRTGDLATHLGTELNIRVQNLMVHTCSAQAGRCKAEGNVRAGGGCRYHFPQKACPTTCVHAENGFVMHKRDEADEKIVTYNPWLTMVFNSHVNVAICGSSQVPAYLYKYVFKGAGKSEVHVSDVDGQGTHAKGDGDDDDDGPDEGIDEIAEYVRARVLCASEAVWMILVGAMHCQFPAVKAVYSHFSNKPMCEKGHSDLDKYLARPDDAELKDLTLLDFLSRYSVELLKEKVQRKTGAGDAVTSSQPGGAGDGMDCEHLHEVREWVITLGRSGRAPTTTTGNVGKQTRYRIYKKRPWCRTYCRLKRVPFHHTEHWALALLLENVPATGSTDYYLQRQVHADKPAPTTFLDACRQHGLLREDNEAVTAFEQARDDLATPDALRFLFLGLLLDGHNALPIIMNNHKSPEQGVMVECADKMSVSFVQKNIFAMMGSSSDADADLVVGDFLRRVHAHTGKWGVCALKMYKIPLPAVQQGINAVDNSPAAFSRAHLKMMKEQLPRILPPGFATFSQTVAMGDATRWINQLQDNRSTNPGVHLVFINGSAGSGKTSWALRIVQQHLENHSVDNVGVGGVYCCAASWLAAGNYPCGVSAHNLFGIGVVDDDDGELPFAMRSSHCDIVIVDELISLHKNVVEAIVNRLEQMCGDGHRQCILIGLGDWRQIPPVVAGYGGTLERTVFSSTLLASTIWQGFKEFDFTEAKRNCRDAPWSAFVQKVGDGLVDCVFKDADAGKKTVFVEKTYPDMKVRHKQTAAAHPFIEVKCGQVFDIGVGVPSPPVFNDHGQPLPATATADEKAAIEFVFPGISTNNDSLRKNSAILCPMNCTAQLWNKLVQSQRRYPLIHLHARHECVEGELAESDVAAVEMHVDSAIPDSVLGLKEGDLCTLMVTIRYGCCAGPL